MTTFNLNQKVRVKLTERGRDILKSDHEAFWADVGRNIPYRPPKEDADGWSEWQLWTLMAALGQHLSIGFSNVMHTGIELEPFDAIQDEEGTWC